MQFDTIRPVRGPDQPYVVTTPQPTASNALSPFKDQDKPASTEPDAAGPFGKDGFTFFDFLDVINPLQHIPIVSTLYREWTGDTIDPGAKMAGATLFGGPIGLVSWIADSLTEAVSGKDIGENILAFFSGDAAQNNQADTPTQIDEAAPRDSFVATVETAAGEQKRMPITAEGVSWVTEQAAKDAADDNERFAIAQR